MPSSLVNYLGMSGRHGATSVRKFQHLQQCGMERKRVGAGFGIPSEPWHNIIHFYQSQARRQTTPDRRKFLLQQTAAGRRQFAVRYDLVRLTFPQLAFGVT